MESSIRELSKYRFDRANEMLMAAEDNLKIGQLRTSLNRSYYAVFHAMRAVNCLDNYDSSKHSGVISHFNQNYIKTEIFDRSLSSIIKSTSYLREKSDYDDFYLTSRQEVESQLANAKKFVIVIGEFLEVKWNQQ